MMRSIVTALVAGLPLAAAPAPAPKEDDPRTQLAKLQGAWRGVSVQTMSQKADDEQAILIFDKSTFTFRRRDKVILRGTFTIDPAKKPKAIDMTITEADAVGYRGKVGLGFYEMDGDTLRWCWSDPLAGPAPKSRPPGRPQEFDPTDPSHVLFTFKREKPPAP